jgi:hypothetical protein
MLRLFWIVLTSATFGGAWLACCRIPAGSESMNVFGLRDNLIRDYEQV